MVQKAKEIDEMKLQDTENHPSTITGSSDGDAQSKLESDVPVAIAERNLPNAVIDKNGTEICDVVRPETSQERVCGGKTLMIEKEKTSDGDRESKSPRLEEKPPDSKVDSCDTNGTEVKEMPAYAKVDSCDAGESELQCIPISELPSYDGQENMDAITVPELTNCEDSEADQNEMAAAESENVGTTADNTNPIEMDSYTTEKSMKTTEKGVKTTDKEVLLSEKDVDHSCGVVNSHTRPIRNYELEEIHKFNLLMSSFEGAYMRPRRAAVAAKIRIENSSNRIVSRRSLSGKTEQKPVKEANGAPGLESTPAKAATLTPTDEVETATVPLSEVESKTTSTPSEHQLGPGSPIISDPEVKLETVKVESEMKSPSSQSTAVSMSPTDSVEIEKQSISSKVAVDSAPSAIEIKTQASIVTQVEKTMLSQSLPLEKAVERLSPTQNIDQAPDIVDELSPFLKEKDPFSSADQTEKTAIESTSSVQVEAVVNSSVAQIESHPLTLEDTATTEVRSEQFVINVLPCAAKTVELPSADELQELLTKKDDVEKNIRKSVGNLASAKNDVILKPKSKRNRRPSKKMQDCMNSFRLESPVRRSRRRSAPTHPKLSETDPCSTCMTESSMSDTSTSETKTPMRDIEKEESSNETMCEKSLNQTEPPVPVSYISSSIPTEHTTAKEDSTKEASLIDSVTVTGNQSEHVVPQPESHVIAMDCSTVITSPKNKMSKKTPKKFTVIKKLPDTKKAVKCSVRAKKEVQTESTSKTAAVSRDEEYGQRENMPTSAIPGAPQPDAVVENSDNFDSMDDEIELGESFKRNSSHSAGKDLGKKCTANIVYDQPTESATSLASEKDDDFPLNCPMTIAKKPVEQRPVNPSKSECLVKINDTVPSKIPPKIQPKIIVPLSRAPNSQLSSKSISKPISTILIIPGKATVSSNAQKPATRVDLRDIGRLLKSTNLTQMNQSLRANQAASTPNSGTPQQRYLLPNGGYKKAPMMTYRFSLPETREQQIYPSGNRLAWFSQEVTQIGTSPTQLTTPRYLVPLTTNSRAADPTFLDAPTQHTAHQNTPQTATFSGAGGETRHTYTNVAHQLLKELAAMTVKAENKENVPGERSGA